MGARFLPRRRSLATLRARLAAALRHVALGRMPSERFEISEGGYARVCLERDHEVELAAAHWPLGSIATLHSHERSVALLRVLRGCVREEQLIPTPHGYRYRATILVAGQMTALPIGGYHQVLGLAEDSITVQAYTPPPDDPHAPPPRDVAALFEREHNMNRELDDEARSAPPPPVPHVE
jgi:hypothetical protein